MPTDRRKSRGKCDRLCWAASASSSGVALGIYDALSASQSLPAKTIAAEIGADEALLYRLMRASAGLELLVEEEGARFRLSCTGQLLSTIIRNRYGAWCSWKKDRCIILSGVTCRL
jgi:hypothetical protein